MANLESLGSAGSSKIRLSIHQGEGNGQAAIDCHPIRDREIELIENDTLSNVPGELRVSEHAGNGSCPESLVDNLKFIIASADVCQRPPRAAARWG